MKYTITCIGTNLCNTYLPVRFRKKFQNLWISMKKLLIKSQDLLACKKVSLIMFKLTVKDQVYNNYLKCKYKENKQLD